MSFSGEKTKKIYRAVFGVALHLKGVPFVCCRLNQNKSVSAYDGLCYITSNNFLKIVITFFQVCVVTLMLHSRPSSGSRTELF